MPGKQAWIIGGLASCLLAAGGTGIVVRAVLYDPEVALLCPEGGAQWIRLDEPVFLGIKPVTDWVAGFRKHIAVAAQPEHAVLTIRAFRGANVLLDGLDVLVTSEDLQTWKQAYQVDLAPWLTPGRHELVLMVLDRNGPPCGLAYCPSLRLFTGADWDASKDGNTWTPALDAGAPHPSQFSRWFPPAYRALRDVLPVLVSIYVLVFCGCLWMQRPTALTRRIRASLFTGARIRWLILSFWMVLAANDLVKLPLYLGFDIRGHTEYVAYVAEHHRIPLATEGWSMFQAPLFYVLSGMLVGAFKSMMSPEAVGRIVRLIPLACGLAQIEIAYRVLRRLWPERDDLQAAGTLVCAFIPMNLYMSQYAGNEPLAACFVALLLLLGLRYVQDGERRRSVRALLVMGFVLGLALLTKFTAVLMIAPLAILIFATGCAPRSFRRPGLAEGGGATGGGAAIYALVSMAKTFAIVLGVAVLVCGWYYLRNWIELGRPFFGGWESSRGIDWWQDPGYRTWRQFCSFGEAMVYPVCSSVVSFWDGVYSSLWADSYMSSMITPAGIPPWNRSFLLGGVWLALIPSGVMLTGLGVILRRPVRAAKQGPLFLVCALGVYFAAMLCGFLTVPYYCVVKASYTLGLLPCYGALIASGVDILGRGRLGRATVYSGLVTWAVVAYLAYFVI